jgi:hypothetical protein
MPLRIYLTGRVLVEDDGKILLDERRLMGRQGRLMFGYLAYEHLRAVSRDELAEELWLGTAPLPGRVHSAPSSASCACSSPVFPTLP